MIFKYRIQSRFSFTSGVEDIRIAVQKIVLAEMSLTVQASLYVKGFGAAAVQKLWLQRRTLLKK